MQKSYHYNTDILIISKITNGFRFFSPVMWDCRTHRQHLYINKCPGYDIKHSDGKAPALEI